LTITLSKQWKLSYESLDNFISLLVSSSLLIAINAFLKTYFSFLLFDASPNLNLFLAAFFVTFAVYNLNKLTDKEEDSLNAPERAFFIRGREKILIIVSMISYLFAIILGTLENFIAVLVLLFPLCAGICYSVKISPNIPRLKDLFLVKSFIVALCWTFGVTFLPIIHLNKGSGIIVFLIFYFFFAKSFINTVLFDIRDIKGDKKNNIKTLPVVIGKEKTKRLLLIINSSFIPWLLISTYLSLFSVYIIPLVFSIFHGYWCINYFSNNSERNKYLLDIMVDGEWFFVVSLCFLELVFH